MRKALLILLVLGLAITAVAGCSSASAPAPTTAPAATAPAPAATTTPTAVAMAPTETYTVAPAPTETPVPTETAAPTKTPVPATPTAAASAGGSDVLNKMKAIRAFSADFTTEQGGQVSTGKIMLSGKKMRMDVESMGVTMAIYLDEEQKTAYMYNPQEKVALSMPYDQGVTGQTPGQMLDWETNMTTPPKPLGEETVDGKDCLVYQFATAEATSKAWIDKETGFPVKYDSTESGQTVSAHFTNIVFGSVDESLLTLPAEAEIQDWSALMGGLATPEAASGSPTPASASSGDLSPKAIVGPVPEALKKNLKVPAGFTLVPDSGQSEENIDTNTYKATAKWTGNATMEQLEAFYDGLMAEGWDSGGLFLSDSTLELAYYQKDSDPVVQLDVSAELGNEGTVLTLTIANGEP